MSFWQSLVRGVGGVLTKPPASAARVEPRPPTAEPDFDEVHAEWLRLHAELVAGRIDPGNAHANQYVAFYDGRVVGYGVDPVALRKKWAEALAVHPERLVVDYLEVL